LETTVRRIYLFVIIICSLLTGPVRGYAQFETASVLGYVHDPSGAAISGASVSLQNLETGTRVTATSNAQGSYQFTDVHVGRYSIDATASGFSGAATDPFAVDVNTRQRVRDSHGLRRR
jgi:hypothetical protein